MLQAETKRFGQPEIRISALLWGENPILKSEPNDTSSDGGIEKSHEENPSPRFARSLGGLVADTCGTGV
jgi:hypothetical protein